MSVTGQHSGPSRKAGRRRFIADAVRAACGVGIAGLMLGFFARQGKALPAWAIRPPGAKAEADFAGACVRCGLCVRDCPYKTLRLAEPGMPMTTGMPYFVAREVPCEMCDDIPCVAACPTGALDKNLTKIGDARMGIAVLTGQEDCLNYLGLRCDVCYRVCPVIDKAIRLEKQHNMRTGAHALFIPVVDGEYCTGCGKCEKSCVLEKAAIRVLPIALVKGELGAHYRLGWEEKEKHGGPLLPDIIDLPDRAPGMTQ